MTTWDDVSVGLIERLDQGLLRDPEFLLARPSYGAVAPESDICVMRLIGVDEQHDGDIVRDSFLPVWRVPIRPRLHFVASDDPPRPDISTGEYLPLNSYAMLLLTPEAVFPPSWVTLDSSHQFSVTLVRYVRTI